MRILILALLALSSTATLHAKEYFIDYLSGADANEGTNPAAAWKHCPGDPAATEAPAYAELKEGDIVRFKGGVTYVLTRAPGIQLRWDGKADKPIVYDGNSDGRWGTGPAYFTDNHSALGLSAFVASEKRRNLRITTCEIGPMGGAAALPADPGGPVEPRFGGGIALLGGAEDVTIEHCVFRELGYWFNRRPMGLASIAGAAITSGSSHGLQVTDCVFSRVARACDLSSASELKEVKITRCTFGEAIAWPVEMPEAFKGKPSAVSVSDCDRDTDDWFDRGRWSGYGEAPLEALRLVPVGGALALQVSAIAAPAPTFQWRKNGVDIPGATQTTLQLNGLRLNDAGIYVAVAMNEEGSAVSNAAVVVVVPTAAYVGDSPGGGGTPTPPPPSTVAPTFTLQPVGQTLTAGQHATLHVAAWGTPEPTFEWRRNGVVLTGATAPTLELLAVTTDDAGDYTAVATNVAGTTTSHVATVNVLVPPPYTPTSPPTSPVEVTGSPSLVAANLLSVDDQPTTMSFTIGSGNARPVLIRAVGPTLSAFHLVGVLADPRLEVFSETTRLAENNNWGGNAAVRAASAGVTFPITDEASADAALLLTLEPGTYHATISPASGGGGLVWIDVYEFR